MPAVQSALGWRYTGEDAFFGLILDRLVECGEKVS